MRYLSRPFRRLQWQLTLTYLIITLVAALTLEAMNVAVTVAAGSPLIPPTDVLLGDALNVGEHVAPYLDSAAPNSAALERYAQTLASSAGLGKTSGATSFSEAQAAQAAQFSAVGMKTHGTVASVAILDANGQVLAYASSDAAAVQRWDQTRVAIVDADVALRSAPQGKEPHILRTLNDGRTLVLVPLTTFDGREVGALAIALQMAPVLQAQGNAVLDVIRKDNLLPSALLFVLLATVVGTCSGMLASHSIRRRVSHIAQAAQAWSRGELEAEIRPAGQDELGQLARDLNAMAGQLQRLMAVRQELAVVEERHRLARDLHDAVKQQLFVVTMLVGTARTQVREALGTTGAHELLAEAERLASHAQQELTALIRALRPVALANGGLAGALRPLASDWAERSGIRVDVEVASELPLTATAEQELFRVAQEALSNVARHSAATAVSVWAGVERQSVVLRITDNGHGFDLAAQAQGGSGVTSGVGLDSMGERVEALGGLLLVSSTPDGTRIEARVPAAEGSAVPRGELATPDADALDADALDASGAPGLAIAPLNAEGTVR